MAGGHRPPLTTDSRTLTCADCGSPWPCSGWRASVDRATPDDPYDLGPHRMSLVLELIGTPPTYGAFCLNCQRPWPCPDAPEESP